MIAGYWVSRPTTSTTYNSSTECTTTLWYDKDECCVRYETYTEPVKIIKSVVKVLIKTVWRIAPKIQYRRIMGLWPFWGLAGGNYGDPSSKLNRNNTPDNLR